MTLPQTVSDPGVAGARIQVGRAGPWRRLSFAITRAGARAVDTAALVCTQSNPDDHAAALPAPVPILTGGQLLYALPHPRRDGSTHLLLDPLEPIEKLAVLIPSPQVSSAPIPRRSGAPRGLALTNCPSCPARSRGGGRNPGHERDAGGGSGFAPGLAIGEPILGGSVEAGLRHRHPNLPPRQRPTAHRRRMQWPETA